MKIAFVMSRNMCFQAQGATSIDLVVHDLVRALTPDHTVTIYAEQVAEPFWGLDVRMFPRRTFWDKALFLKRIAAAIRVDEPDAVVVEQHPPTLSRLRSWLPNVPMILHRHNFWDLGAGPWWRRLIHPYQACQADALAFCSQACVHDFQQRCPPSVMTPVFVVPNAIDLAAWVPQDIRVKEILMVGRMAPEKGVLEWARAVADVLPDFPDWSARLICSAVDVHLAYRDQVLGVLDPLRGRVRIDVNQPRSVVKAANERAAVAVVASMGRESFGLTALEAMAGGAALISSTKGGLSEVVGEAAVRLPHVTANAIAAALRQLLADGEGRLALAAAGRARAEQFSIQAQVAAFLAVCDQASSGAG